LEETPSNFFEYQSSGDGRTAVRRVQ
jgi:hypothetical protein